LARRSPGEGSVFKRKKDGRIVVQIPLPEGGRRVFYSRDDGTVFDTNADGKTFLADQMAKLKGGFPLGPGEPLAGVLARWLEVVARPRVDDRTYEDYESLIRLHVIPTLGDVPVGRLTGQHLETLYDKKRTEPQGKRKEPLSERRIQYIHAVLHTALKHVHKKWRLITSNPAEDVDAPRPTKRRAPILNVNEAKQLLLTAQDDPLEALYVLALTTTMRQGELLGLHWEAIDLEEGLLHVIQNLQRRGGIWRLKDPKTDSGRRPIRLAHMAVEALRRHRARQADIRARANGTWQDTGLVFCDETGGPLNGKDVTMKCFYPLLKRSGLEMEGFRFHDLRHTAGSFYMAMGVPPKVVQEMMGHSTIAMTLDTYSHSLPDLQAQAVAKMNELLGPGSAQ
jgi:integrase